MLSKLALSVQNGSSRTRFYFLLGITLSALMISLGTYTKYRLSQEPPRQPPAVWHSVTPSPIPRVEGPGAVVDGKVYLFGGFRFRTLQATRRGYVYDPTTDQWNRLADMPVANTHIVAAVDGNTIWYAGGFVGNHPGKATRKVYKYHVPSDRWIIGPPLPKPRAGGILVRLGRNLHYVSGLSLDRNTNYGDHWILPLDGVQKWSARAQLPMPRSHSAGAVLNGLIYVIGGQFRHDDNRQDVAFVHRYDPHMDRWTEVSPLPFNLSHTELSSVVWKGRIYVFGGRSDPSGDILRKLYQPQPYRRGAALPDVLAYDPATDKWEPQPELPVGLLAPVVVKIDDKIVVTNGSTMFAYFPQSSTYVGCFPLQFLPTTAQSPSC